MTNLDSILKSRGITLPTRSVLSRLWLFQWSCMDVRVGLWRELSAEESMLLNCGVGEDSWESLGLQGDPTSPSWRRSVLGVHWKHWCWSWNSNTLATSCEELTHWKRPLCWEGLGTGGEGDDRGWDGWMASPTRWTWVWVNSRGWWRTGKPGMLWFMGSQRIGHDWAMERNWTEGYAGSIRWSSEVPLIRQSSAGQSHLHHYTLGFPLKTSILQGQKGLFQAVLLWWNSLEYPIRISELKTLKAGRNLKDQSDITGKSITC